MDQIVTPIKVHSWKPEPKCYSAYQTFKDSVKIRLWGWVIVQSDSVFISERDTEKHQAEIQSRACEDTVRGGCLHVKERLRRSQTLSALILGVSFQSCWKTNFCCVSFTVYILLW